MVWVYRLVAFPLVVHKVDLPVVGERLQFSVEVFISTV